MLLIHWVSQGSDSLPAGLKCYLSSATYVGSLSQYNTSGMDYPSSHLCCQSAQILSYYAMRLLAYQAIRPLGYQVIKPLGYQAIVCFDVICFSQRNKQEMVACMFIRMYACVSVCAFA